MLKIVTWNCNGAFRNKFQFISVLNADIYVIQECENPSETKDEKYQKWGENFLWIGDNKNKGLAVFARRGIKLEKLEWTNEFKDHSVKHFLPCRINRDFNLLAIWTHRNKSPNFGYIGQLWKYLQINKDKLNESILVGDFNSNSIWDQWDRWWNHSDVVNELKEIGIESFYHKFTNEVQGKESKPTLYFQRKLLRPYHIDYIFGSQKFISSVRNLEIGEHNDWIKLSDHMPILCDIDF
jgi:exonuclease III